MKNCSPMFKRGWSLLARAALGLGLATISLSGQAQEYATDPYVQAETWVHLWGNGPNTSSSPPPIQLTAARRASERIQHSRSFEPFKYNNFDFWGDQRVRTVYGLKQTSDFVGRRVRAAQALHDELMKPGNSWFAASYQLFGANQLLALEALNAYSNIESEVCGPGCFSVATGGIPIGQVASAHASILARGQRLTRLAPLPRPAAPLELARAWGGNAAHVDSLTAAIADHVTHGGQLPRQLQDGLVALSRQARPIDIDSIARTPMIRRYLSIDQRLGLKFVSDEALSIFEANVINGQIWRGGAPLQPNGYSPYFYVLTNEGTFLVATQDELMRLTGSHVAHHSQLANSKPVLGAGTLQIESPGSLLYITRASGHYRPAAEAFANFLNIMANRGLDFSSAMIMTDPH